MVSRDAGESSPYRRRERVAGIWALQRWIRPLHVKEAMTSNRNAVRKLALEPAEALIKICGRSGGTNHCTASELDQDVSCSPSTYKDAIPVESAA
jgi:hypothetical protein